MPVKRQIHTNLNKKIWVLLKQHQAFFNAFQITNQIWIIFGVLRKIHWLENPLQIGLQTLISDIKFSLWQNRGKLPLQGLHLRTANDEPQIVLSLTNASNAISHYTVAIKRHIHQMSFLSSFQTVQQTKLQQQSHFSVALSSQIFILVLLCN